MRKNFSQEQIISILREGESGVNISLIRKHGIVNER